MHITTEMFGYTVHADTLYFAWACMALIILASAIFASGLNSDPNKYGLRQHMAEAIFNFIRGIADNQIGKKHGPKFVFLLGSIFLFVFVSYYAGLIPWKMGAMFDWWPQMSAQLEHAPAAAEHVAQAAGHAASHGHEAIHAAEHSAHASHPWHGASPCADLNVTAGLAIIVVFAYLLAGVLVGGWRYVETFLPIEFSQIGKKGIRSINLICLIELMDLIVRPLTLSLRLFANTFAGEQLLVTFIGIFWLFLPLPIVGFEMFVGVLQAFLFAILASVYIGTAVQHAEHLAHDH